MTTPSTKFEMGNLPRNKTFGTQKTSRAQENDASLFKSGNEHSKSNIRLNDFLEPVQDLRHIHRFKFDPESPLFAQAAANLQVSMHDIVRKRIKDFRREVLIEQPESETNPQLVNELATIKYNYHISSFKDTINDIIEERDRIKYDNRIRAEKAERQMARQEKNMSTMPHVQSSIHLREGNGKISPGKMSPRAAMNSS